MSSAHQHSVTLLLGVRTDISVPTYLVDAIIGLSVVYKALDNMGAWHRWFGFQPSTKTATLIFGLVHGFGRATKLQGVLPAECGVDPTRVGSLLGLTEMGRIKMQLASEAEAEEAGALPVAASSGGPDFPAVERRNAGDPDRRDGADPCA